MSTTLLSPYAGTLHPITEAPDPVFSEKMLGDGFFITPSIGEVLAPADGEITYVAPTKHGIRIAAADGTKLTLHVGTESGELKGEGFTVFVETGEKVRKGDKLMTFSPELLQQNPKTTDACILLLEDMEDGREVRLTASGEVTALTPVAEVV